MRRVLSNFHATLVSRLSAVTRHTIRLNNMTLKAARIVGDGAPLGDCPLSVRGIRSRLGRLTSHCTVITGSMHGTVNRTGSSSATSVLATTSHSLSGFL